MKMLIDSQWTDSANHQTKVVKNPGTGEVIDEVPQATEGDIDRALKAAEEGKKRMSATPAYRRSEILTRAAEIIHERKEELATLLAKENGKPIGQTRAEVEVAGRLFSGFAEEGRRMFGRTIPMDSVPGNERHFAMTIRQPIGVVAAIVPFNYPVELFAHKVAAALAAGNAVITKPPSACPLTLLKIAEILENAGLPRGVHQMITGPGELVGERLALSPIVRLLSLTGSVPVGIKLAELGAKNLQKIHLELGGNDAMIVCVDADIEKATDAVILGRLARGNGQICCAVKRIFIDRRIYKDFCAMLVLKASHLKVGDQLAEDTDCGPLISENAARKVENSIIEAVRAGAKLLYGGSRNGAFIIPTVLAEVSPSMPLFQEETFGPVAPLVAFQNVEEAIRMANDSQFGLQASVFTNDISQAMTIARQLEAGGIIINWSSALRAENVPFGGIKLSGHGREALHDTLTGMTEEKAIIIHNAFPQALNREVVEP